jgi:signal peptidase II
MAMAVASRYRRAGLVLAVAALVVAADQATKTWAEHRLAGRTIHLVWTLRLRLELNSGVAFSLGRGSTGLVTALAAAILTVVAVVAWRTTGRVLGVALGLITGGAASNLVDRLVRHHGGQVIDFIDLRWWPVFNVADAAITCGVVLALVLGTVGGRRAVPVPASR